MAAIRVLLATGALLALALSALATPASAYGVIHTGVSAFCEAVGPENCRDVRGVCTGAVGVYCSDPRDPGHWPSCDVWIPGNCF